MSTVKFIYSPSTLANQKLCGDFIQITSFLFKSQIEKVQIVVKCVYVYFYLTCTSNNQLTMLFKCILTLGKR